MAAREFFDVITESLAALAPGIKNIGPEVGAELSRLGTQGAMEMSQALFNGAAFTPYGPGQYTETPKLDTGTPEPEQQQNLERGGREM